MVVCPFDRDVSYDIAWIERQIEAMNAIIAEPTFAVDGETPLRNEDIVKIVQALKYALYYKYDG